MGEYCKEIKVSVQFGSQSDFVGTVCDDADDILPEYRPI